MCSRILSNPVGGPLLQVAVPNVCELPSYGMLLGLPSGRWNEKLSNAAGSVQALRSAPFALGSTVIVLGRVAEYTQNSISPGTPPEPFCHERYERVGHRVADGCGRSPDTIGGLGIPGAAVRTAIDGGRCGRRSDHRDQ